LSLEFHLTHYERYRKEGIEAHRRGDGERARFCLLKSAEHLYSVARASDGRLKEERARRASELVELANRVGSSIGDGTVDGRRRESDEGGPEAERGGERFLVGERPTVTFDDIAGLEDVKEEVRLKIIHPFRHPELAERYGIRAGGGILLYGPPGTGKTLMARAVAGETECAFFTVKPSEILSKWVGEAEQNMSALFAAARERSPSVIFIDEIEALAPRRAENRSSVMARLVPQILAELEGFSSNRGTILFLGATNEPWSLDPAILRPGRFDERVYIGLPDRSARQRMLELHLDGRPLADDVDLDRLAALMDGFSGADIRNLCRKAADDAFRRAIVENTERPIDQQLLLENLEEVEPSVRPEDLEKFRRYRGEGGD